MNRLAVAVVHDEAAAPGSASSCEAALVALVAASGGAEGSEGGRLVLDNRYFSAVLTLDRTMAPADAGAALVVAHKAVPALASQPPVALLAQASEAGVRLLLGVGGAAVPAPEGLLEYCADHEIEFVDLDEVDAAFGEGTEQTGAQRVLEALSVHAWPEMTLKPRGKTPRAAAAEEETLTATVADASAEPTDRPTTTEATDRLTTEAVNREAERIYQMCFQPGAAAADEDPSARLERALGAIKSVRDVATKASDTDRRRIAAEFAMALMQQLGDDDDDDDEQDDGHSSGDDA